MNSLHVVKIGGNVIDDAEQLQHFLHAFSAMEGKKILVHGGGTRATQLSHRLGVAPVMIDGRRVTTAADLDVAIMVYAGLINKQIVATLQRFGCNAIGLTGADGNVIRAVKRPVRTIDYGFVGDIEQVNGNFISTLVETGLIPVMSALTHDHHGQLLNTNADTIAAEVAIAMAEYYETALTYCFEKNGVLSDINDPESVIPLVDRERYDQLRNDGRLHSGMMPKIENCFGALERGVRSVQICNAAGLASSEKRGTMMILSGG